jgi:hypothetical protein
VGDGLPDEDRAAPHWEWGVAGADGVLSAAADLLKRLIEVVPVDDVPALATLRENLHAVRAEVRATFDGFDQWWQDAGLDHVAPGTSYWLLRLAAYEHVMFGSTDQSARRGYQVDALAGMKDEHRGPAAEVLEAIFKKKPGEMGRKVAALVGDGAEIVRGVLPLLADEDVVRLAALGHWRTLLPPGTSRDAVLARLLCLDIATFSLAGEAPRELDYPVELVQLSLQAASPFMRYTRTADDKVGGMAILRFSGFLKRSWRVNDWTWGRIDAATMLCQILLKPARLRRVAELEGTLADDRHDAEARSRR